MCQVKLAKSIQLECQFDFLKIIWNKKRKLVMGCNTSFKADQVLCHPPDQRRALPSPSLQKPLKGNNSANNFEISENTKCTVATKTKPAITQVKHLPLLQGDSFPTTLTKQSCLQTALFCVPYHYYRTLKNRNSDSILFSVLFVLH